MTISDHADTAQSADAVVYLIPAYQPTETLVDVLGKLRALTSDPVIIVNDGSDAKTASIFAACALHAHVTLITHPVNRGKGEAIKTGLVAVLAMPNVKGVITLDADGQHRPEDALAVGKALAEHGTALVLGCRAFDATHKVPFRSRFGNVLTRHIFRILTSISISDSQTGLRGIPLSLVKPLLNVTAGGYEFETEMLLMAVRQHVPIREVAIPTIYIDNNNGSHFNPILDSLRIYFVLCRFALSSLLTTATDFLVFALAHYLSGQLLFSLICGRIVACCVQFILCKKFVFMSHNNSSREFLRYVMLVIIFLCITQAGMKLLLSHTSINVIWAKIMMESGLFVLSFTAQKLFVFRQHDNQPPTADVRPVDVIRELNSKTLEDNGAAERN